MTWNYRVIRVDYIYEGKTEPCFAVHRCYYEYEADLIPTKWSQSPASPEGETLGELLDDYSRLRLAFEKPVLVEERGKLVEAKP